MSRTTPAQDSQRLLESMTGLHGPRDELTRYTTPLTGAYHFAAAVGAVRRHATTELDDETLEIFRQVRTRPGADPDRW